MASTTQRKAFISYKLAFLKDQRDHFISAFGLYINGIIESGESWTERGDNKMEYSELCHTIDTATMVLIEKCEELAGVSGRVEGSQLSFSSCELSDLTLQTRKSTVQSAGETQLKPILARIAVIEEAMCSFRRNAEVIGEEQNSCDQQMKQLVSNHCDLKKKCGSKCKKVMEQVSEINQTLTDLDKQHETKLQGLEKQLQIIYKAQDRRELEMESQAELIEKLLHLSDQLESVKENLDVLEARIERSIDDCSNKHQDTENLMRDLEFKVMTTRETVQVISEGHEMLLLRELETWLQTLKADTKRHVEDEKEEKMEVNFRIFCQMLNNRLTPLEELRTCLNQRASTRDDNIKKLTQVIQDVAVMSQRLQQLELTSSRVRCGFTASKWLGGLGTGDSIGLYEELYCNVGDNFQADSGIFTAPVDGLYVAAISIYLYENRTLKVGVSYTKQGLYQGSDWVCYSSAMVKGTSTCDVGVVDMKAGDTLVAFVEQNNTTNEQQKAYFSCFLLA